MAISDAPRFKLPLSRAILDDPAFSPDPRSHPHFDATHKALPAKSPPRIIPIPALSPSSSLSSFSASTPSPVSPLPHSPSDSISPRPQHPFPLPLPEILPNPNGTDTLAIKPQNHRFPRKGRMKALVRRLTSRHNLDRIDELDETDPFGGSYHHDGPYEAIGSNLAQPSLPHRPPRRAHVHHSERESHLRLSRPGQHQVPSTHGETGLSIHLEPGQVLQQNIVYSPHVSSIASVPSQSRPQPNAIAVVTRPDHSRRPSLPNPRTRSLEDSSLDLIGSFHYQPLSSLHAPRERCPGDNTSDIPGSLPSYHDRDTAPYGLRQAETTFFRPPRYESRFHNSGPPRSPQRTPPPSTNLTSRRTQSTESTMPVLPPPTPRRKSVHSPDSLYTFNGAITQPTSSVQNMPLEPPRIRHLPKRLVMPALLQPQLPQSQHKFPPTEAVTREDEYPNNHALGQPAMCIREPRILRRRSSTYPAKEPLPDHAPISQDDAMPIMRRSPMKTANEAEGAKERTRRRRLSKRKNDI